MKTLRNILTVALGIMVTMPMMAQAQEFVFNNDHGTMTIEGTSNLHDWEETVEKFSGSVTLASNVSDLASSTSPLSAVNFSAQVESIESGKSIMNNKTHDALKSDDHPTITFNSTKVKLYKTKDASNGEYIFIVYGKLSMAGESKEIYFPVKTKINEDGTWNVSGNKKIYMEWFNIDPPSAMMGSITVGDEVDVKFKLNLISSENASN